MAPGDDDREQATTQDRQPGRDAPTTVGMQLPFLNSPMDGAARPPGDAPATASTIPHVRVGMPHLPGQGAATAQQPANRIRSTSISNDGGSTMSGSDQGTNPDDPLGSKKRRTPRQQEQNKQAQQRYRQKRKAQFEELQQKVNVLTDQLRQFEKEKQLRQERELESFRKKAAAQAQAHAHAHGIATSSAFGGHPSVPSGSAVSLLHPTAIAPTKAAAASLMGGGMPMMRGPVLHADDDVATVLNNLTQAAKIGEDVQAIENILQMLANTNSTKVQERKDGGAAAAAAKTTHTNHNPTSSTPGHLFMHTQPQAQTQAQIKTQTKTHQQSDRTFSRPAGWDGHATTQPTNLATSLARATSSGWNGAPTKTRVPPDQLRGVVDEFRRQSGAILECLSASSHPGSNAPRIEEPALIQFRETAIEIASGILKVSAAQAADVLQDGSPGTIPSAADSPGHWRGVVDAINLDAHQASAVLAWRDSFLGTLDQMYKKRAAIKLRVMQSVDGADANATSVAAAQSVETVLVHVARMHGYAFLAQAGSELVAEAEDLLKSVEDERQAAINGLTMLLRDVLLPRQAARYICVAYPFFWNVLAFSHAVAAVHGNGLRGPGADG